MCGWHFQKILTREETQNIFVGSVAGGLIGVALAGGVGAIVGLLIGSALAVGTNENERNRRKQWY